MEKKMKHLFRKRIISALLAVFLVVSMLPITTSAAANADHVVISQAYGGGGNSGAEYKNDFVELYNPTAQDVNLSGWTVQYASKAGTFSAKYTFASTDTIKAGGYFLIQMAAGSGGTKDLPTPDGVGTASMGGSEFKVALVKNAEAITGKDDADVVDLVGVGGGANEYEGTGPAPKASNTTAVVRNSPGVDTDDNAADFKTAAPDPHNSGASGGTGGGSTEPPVLTVVPISTALAGESGASFTVKGVVTAVDSRNVYLQDATGGICLRVGANQSYTLLGKTVTGTGTLGAYNGMPQLTGSIDAQSDELTLTPKATTVDALTAADLCTYVKLTGMKVTKVSDGSTLNIDLEDANGNSIQIYKAAVGKTDGFLNVQVGDTVDVTAAVGCYNDTLQLRNTSYSEIVVTAESTTPVTPTASLPSGTVTAPAQLELSAPRDAEIYYTTDGSEPTASSQKYTAAITVDKTMTVKAVSALGGVLSPVLTLEYTYDDTQEEDAPIITDTFTLVTDAADLKAEDQIIIVSKEEAFALSTKQNTNNRGQIEIVKKDNTVELVDELQVITLEEGMAAGQFAFNVGEGYLYAASNDSNHLKVQTTLDANGSWLITVDKDGVATVKAQGANGRNWLRHNSSSKIFSCYGATSSQKDILIYKRNIVEDPVTADMVTGGILTLDKATAATSESVTLIGQVVYHYGNPYNGSDSINSIILEDIIGGEIYGFQVYDYTNYAKYIVGDVVKITGTITVYNGVPQMSSPTMEVVKAGLEPIPAQTITVSQMGADYLSEYVFIDGVTLGTYNGSGNTTVTDATGTVNLYKGAGLPGGSTVADITGVYGACSAYKTTYQLRNGTAKDYVSTATGSGTVKEGDKVVLYNLSAQGVLAAEGDNQVIRNALTTLEDGKALPGNGGVVFTVEKNGEYYRFHNETYGYLCSNGTGNNAFYSATASEDADWTLSDGKKGGYFLESRTAKFNGTYSQFLEYYSDSYKTYSMYNVTDYDIYEFLLCPVAEGVSLTDGIVNAPTVDFGTVQDAYLGSDYSFSYTFDLVFLLKEMSVQVNGQTVTPHAANGVFTVELPGEQVTGTALTVSVTIEDVKGVTATATVSIPVKDEPSLSGFTPVAGLQTGADKRPVISVKVANAGENPTCTMLIGQTQVDAQLKDGVLSYTPTADLPDGRTSVTVTVKRADGKEVTKTWTFTVGKAQFQLYFGQLHSHTTYSDGSGTLESGLEYIKNLPDSANVDFVAFTDHSNYFDTKDAANPEGALWDVTQMTASSKTLWDAYTGAMRAFNQSQSDVIAIPGFEMTWSGGPGHMNTFNTPGIVSRNNANLNKKDSDAGMKAYYAQLSKPEGVNAISQFNHPGSTFGTFSDFAHWDAVLDTRIQLVEVGNGEGQIGAGGYFPSYEYYTMALDKGWHVAPTNNQDNHKGKWGNANNARDVVLTDNFTEEGLYQAIRDRRVYATEDKNLEIYYTVNGSQLGTVISEVPEKLELNVVVNDPDASDSISKVEVIVNSGKVAHTWSNPTELAAGELTATLAPDYSYYYIRVTQNDGDLAVTAPVWVGETLKLGISSVVSGTSTPVTKEEVEITTTFFNSEAKEAKVKSIVYTVDGSKVISTDNTGYTVPAAGTVSATLKYTPDTAKLTKITATAVMEQDGKEYEFTMDVTLDVQDADKLVYLGIDASHYNEYVAGNYKDNMGNFSGLAAGYSVRTVELKTSQDLIDACSNPKFAAIILTAPSRRLAAAQTELRCYTDAEIDAINKFNQNGGIVILAGWSDHYENYPEVFGTNNANLTADKHMAAQQNAILEAMGSNLRIGDDATYDDTYNGGQAYRLYFNTYGDSFLTEGVEVDPEHPHDRQYTEVFSQYGGATVYTVDGTLPSTVKPVVFGHSGTYSVDADKDGLGGSTVPKYQSPEGDQRLMVMATEELPGRGMIVVSGAAFMSNFEVQAEMDNGSQKNYSNYRICENLMEAINPTDITPIAQVQKQTQVGYKYTIEGIVTSNASGYDKATAFFDCIYVQDATGGICCFPVSGEYKIGDKVRVTGTTEFYQGEMELQVTKIQKLGEETPVEPKEVTAAQINDRSVIGQLVTVKGTVVSYEIENGLVQTIMVKDEAGNTCRVFIDGYITTPSVGARAATPDILNLKDGCKITVTGLASYDDTFNAPMGPFARIRVRNRNEVVCTPATANPDTGDTFQPVLVLAVLLASALGMFALVLGRKKLVR